MEENKETTPELPQDDHLNQETISQEETEKVINDINAATIDPREEEIALLKKQVDEYKDKHLRLFADFDNFKKRNAKERLDLILTAGKDVIQDMLPILDDFERATKALENTSDVEAVKEGMKLIQTKLIKTLDGKGLKAIESIGKDFNCLLYTSPSPRDS